MTLRDLMLEREACRLVVENQLGAIGMLQRELGIGYAKAAQLMTCLEEQSIVGPPNGTRSRTVNITPDQLATILATQFALPAGMT